MRLDLVPSKSIFVIYADPILPPLIDDFENISQCYHDFFNHTITGGLKVFLATAFGRAQKWVVATRILMGRPVWCGVCIEKYGCLC
jgi:hypothetical protein